MYSVYILKCIDGTLYTGIAKDVDKRINEHNGVDDTQKNKKGAKYTRTRRPVQLVYSKKYSSRSEAQKEEYRIKQLTRKQKELLLGKAINIQGDTSCRPV